MTLVAFFLLGLSLGIFFYFWQINQLNRQLRQLLLTVVAEENLTVFLSTFSLIRRAIIDIKKQRQALLQEIRNWEYTLEQAPIGYLRIDEENQLRWCNFKARELLQIDRWQPDQLRLLLELVRSYELDSLIQITRQSQKPQVKEWLYSYTQANNPDNFVVTEQFNLKKIKQLPLKATTFLLPQQEIGIFLENQQRLTQLTEERDRAFSDLTHELRTPLTSIALVAETLSKRLHPPEVNWVERMLNETNRLIDLIQNWLDLSQLHANPSQYLNYQNFSLRDLISTVWYNLEPLAEKKQIKLIITGVEQVEILADKSRLTQVFANILDNGIKHSPQASPITLHLSLGGSDSQAKSLVICDIIDSGEGFLEADLPYVFNRLYRGDTSRKRNSNSFHTLAQGSGLGLSIAQEIVQAHGGKIIARNHPQTKGAWLQIILPLQPNHVTPPVKKTQKR